MDFLGNSWEIPHFPKKENISLLLFYFDHFFISAGAMNQAPAEYKTILYNKQGGFDESNPYRM
jgi:hypothetical protein